MEGAARVDVRVHGPVAEPRAEASFEQIAARLPGLPLEQLEGRAAIDVALLKLTLPHLSARALGGRVEGQGDLDLESLQWMAQLRSIGLDTTNLATSLAGRLDGHIALSGRLGSAQSGLAVVDLRLRRTRRRGPDPLPAQIVMRGSVHLNPPILDLAGVTLSAGGNAVRARGSINLAERRSNVFLSLDMPRFGSWLEQQIGVPLIRSLRGGVRLYGVYPRLKMRGDLELRHVGHGTRRLDRLVAQLGFGEGTLRLTDLRGQGYGGRLHGEASLQLFEGDLSRPLARPSLRASLRADGFDLKRMGLGAYGVGVVAAQADLSGPLDALTGMARVRIPELLVQGDRYAPVEARVGLLRDRISLYELRLPRAAGGSLRARGELFHDGRLQASVFAQAFPLAGVPGLGRAPLRGRLSGRLELSGKLADPRLAGELALKDLRVRGARLGDGSVRFVPSRDAVTITGALGAGLVRLNGLALMRPRPSLHLEIDLRRFPLHELAPELAGLGVGEITAVTSGEVRLDLDSEQGLTWGAARLSLLAFSLRYRPLGKRISQSLELMNQEDLLLTYSDERLHVVTARLVSSTPGRSAAQAEFAVGGFLSEGGSDLAIRGRVPLELVEFFLARRVQRVSGVAQADVKLSGPLSALVGVGVLGLREVRIKLPAFERPIEIPAGQVRLTPGQLELSSLRFRVGPRQLRAWGTLRLAQGSLVRPEAVDMHLEGDLDMGLLQLLFPEQLSFSRGDAHVELALVGPVRDPRADGELRIGHVELRPRGLGRIVSLQQGRLSFSNYLVCLGGRSVCDNGGTTCPAYEQSCRLDQPLQGTFDEGTIVVQGQGRFDQGELVDLELGLKGSSIPQRKPQVYTAELNADLHLLGDARSLALDGTVDIIDGRYVREFEILKDLVVRPRTHEEADPFWRGVPLLEQMSLRLLLRSTGSLRVRNRNADLSLAAALSVSGTLDEPRLDGTLRVEEGSFSIPFLRGEYRVERGDISFQDGRPAEQAQLDILAETQYLDRSGTDYRIAMQLRGSLERMRIRLTSQPHLDQGQILALLATGRTTDQWRAQLNSAEQGTAAAGMDTQVKELTGTLLGGMIGDPLERAFGLDLVRLEIGTETVTARACKNVGTALEFCGEGEKNLLGGFGGRATMNYKVHDYLRLMGRLERLSTRIEREQENPSRGRVELKFRLPIQ